MRVSDTTTPLTPSSGERSSRTEFIVQLWLRTRNARMSRLAAALDQGAREPTLDVVEISSAGRRRADESARAGAGASAAARNGSFQPAQRPRW